MQSTYFNLEKSRLPLLHKDLETYGKFPATWVSINLTTEKCVFSGMIAKQFVFVKWNPAGKCKTQFIKTVCNQNWYEVKSMFKDIIQRSQ
jgi:hypothetical protein